MFTQTIGNGGLFPLWGVVVLLGLALCGVVYVTSEDDRLPRYHFLLVVFAFIVTILWLDLLASETVAVLESAGTMFGISTSIMGCTILAWGNCIGDYVADTAIARAGRPKTAVASCFGSPLFSQIMALGFPITVYCIKHGDLKAEVDDQVVAAFCFMTLVIVSSLVVFPLYNYHGPKKYALYLFFCYFLFMLASTLIELDVVSLNVGQV